MTYLCHNSIFVKSSVQFSSVQYSHSLSRVWLFVTPRTTARQASLSITNSWSLLRLMSIESVMPSNHLIHCCPLLLQPSVFPSIRVFSKESALHFWWPKYWSFNFSISSSISIQGWFPLGLTGLILEWVAIAFSNRDLTVLNIHWKDGCWSWNSNHLATWYEELTHLKRPWCWERLKAGGKGNDRVWDGRTA